MSYYLNLTLQQKATLSAAISVWNSQKAKDKISKWSDDNFQKLKLEEAERYIWQQLTEEVLKEVNQIVLPSQLTGELIHVVKVLGKKIYNWSTYISYEYYCIHEVEGDMTNYIREIYWTPIGTIDEVKILQEFWLKNPDLDFAVVYKIACKNALEKDINDLWQKMPRNIQDDYDKIDLSVDVLPNFESPYYYYFILAYWKYRTVGQINTSTRDIDPHDRLGNTAMRVWHNQNYSRNYKMFLLSVYKGYNTAVKYFWEKLTQEERDRGVLYAAYLAVVRNRWVGNFKYIGEYMKETYVEILIFLLNQMTPNQIKSFLRGDSAPYGVNDLDVEIINVKKGILSMLSSFWPWQELFIPVLKNMLQYLEHNAEPVLGALLEISRYMVKPGYAPENSKYQSMLRDAWFIMPGSMKRMIAHKTYNSDIIVWCNFMTELLGIGDLDSIKMIFDDPEITDLRMQYIKLGQDGYESLIKSNEYELLNQFVEKVLRTEEEKIYLKRLIDHISFCQRFIKTSEFDSADKLIDWIFETAEERKQCKNQFKYHDCTIDFVVETLKSCEGSVDETKKITSGFFKWLLESEDDIAVFKKECIAIFDGMDHYTLYEEKAQKIRQILA